MAAVLQASAERIQIHALCLRISNVQSPNGAYVDSPSAGGALLQPATANVVVFAPLLTNTLKSTGCPDRQQRSAGVKLANQIFHLGVQG